MNKLKTKIILEMLGRPKEHIVETMAKLVETLAKEKGIKISEKIIHEPKKMENQGKDGKVIEMSEDKQLYTTFAEIDIEAEDILTLTGIAFRYMPSHMEISSPEELTLDNFNLNIMINELVTRLHQYDSIAKSALINNKLLSEKMQEIIKETGYIESKVEEKEDVSEKIQESKEEAKDSPKQKKKKK